MKVIDLLNKIANGEEVPKKLKIKQWEYNSEYENLEYELFDRLYEADFKLNEEVEILEEEKKIPEKLEDRARFQYSQIPYWFKDKELIKTINENFEKHQKAIYEIIDYLKSKGE